MWRGAVSGWVALLVHVLQEELVLAVDEEEVVVSVEVSEVVSSCLQVVSESVWTGDGWRCWWW